jgi:hypothetical protein
MTRPPVLRPGRPLAPPRQRRPAGAPPRLAPPQLTTPLADEALRRWFEEEAGALQRLAHTQRLKGDYVAAQTLEREIRNLERETAARLEGTAARKLEP